MENNLFLISKTVAVLGSIQRYILHLGPKGGGIEVVTSVADLAIGALPPGGSHRQYQPAASTWEKHINYKGDKQWAQVTGAALATTT